MNHVIDSTRQTTLLSASVSPNTQAILLLTAPLLLGRNSPAAELLSHNEYKQLARHLRENGHQPCDLLSHHAADLIHACQPIINEQRLRQLLARGFLLSQAVTHWHSRAIWVVSRADPHYPVRLKTRLREDAPAILYGCGDMSLLNTGGLAVVGSRDADQSEQDYARHAGQLSAQAEKMLISGGARGIDQAAMQGASIAQGWVCEVMAEKLERAALDHQRRAALMENRLVLVSAFDPNAGFNVGHAMQRNKHIYALADAALVVASDYNHGGTWAGAIEQLDKMNLVPIYVRSSGKATKGLHALQQKGALLWPEPQDGAALHALLHAPQAKTLAKNTSLPLFSNYDTPEPTIKDRNDNPAQLLFSSVREILQEILVVPMNDTSVANALDISQAQAQTWLQRMVDEGTLTYDQGTPSYGLYSKKILPLKVDCEPPSHRTTEPPK